jgi:hypothetical protein
LSLGELLAKADNTITLIAELGVNPATNNPASLLDANQRCQDLLTENRRIQQEFANYIARRREHREKVKGLLERLHEKLDVALANKKQ